MTNAFSPSKIAFLMVMAMLLIAINDNIIKLISSDLSATQILTVRGFVASCLLAAFIKTRGLTFTPKEALSKANIIRGALEGISSGCMVASLGLIPISAASMLAWSAPIFSTILGATILKENVGIIRWTSVAIGFLGVILISNPSAPDFSWAYLLPIITAISMAGRDVVTRKISTSLHPYHITLVTTICVMFIGLAASIVSGFSGWNELMLYHLSLIALSSFFITSSFILMVIAVQHGELSFIAPFSFSGAIFGVLAGKLIWNESFSPMTIMGIVLISIAAIVILMRQSHDEN